MSNEQQIVAVRNFENRSYNRITTLAIDDDTISKMIWCVIDNKKIKGDRYHVYFKDGTILCMSDMPYTNDGYWFWITPGFNNQKVMMTPIDTVVPWDKLSGDLKGHVWVCIWFCYDEYIMRSGEMGIPLEQVRSSLLEQHNKKAH